ncbi:MAG TPA: prolipoprotein diacylglyceryl transferase family protein [candidate division Zixibacteria bacterium]|nr:prolipoprotein diacylglyceryl transferase family protein [candidate division Zixibacteria bacterium]
MYPILFQFGPVTIYSFGAMMAVAALAAAWVVHKELRERGYNPELASTMVFAAAIGGLAGARILFILEDLPSFLRSPGQFIFTGAGFTWYGGLIGGALAVTWVVKKNGIPWLVGADIAAPALAIGYGIGRIGCHVAGDGDWGTVTDVPWGVAYTHAIIGWVNPLTGVPYPPGTRVHPTPIYEFLESLIIFGILWGLRKKNPAPGVIAWIYLALAGLARFAVEFWRVNPPVAFGLTEAQLFSVVLMLVGAAMLARRSMMTAVT